MSENTKRAVEMLRVAARYIENNSFGDELIRYDDADCDGYCVADDCKSAAQWLEAEIANAEKEAIAAAPEPLEALKGLVTYVLDVQGYHEANELKAALASITKAEQTDV